ncbi:MAG TPA: hypothetical protein VIT44_05825 [Cyclobacteriaceae bacterium]
MTHYTKYSVAQTGDGNMDIVPYLSLVYPMKYFLYRQKAMLQLRIIRTP